jgi:hypothetical protein
MDPGALVGAVAALSVGALVALLLLARAGRSARARRQALAAELARSRADVDALSRRVADLADELRETRQTAAADHEYVITSLGGEAGSGDVPAVQVVDARVLRPRPPALGRLLEDRLVGALRRQGASGSPGRLGGLVVRAVAVGHGVRRALSPDVLDRAAAESQVARRRSRRTRRQELRDARRLVRSVNPGGSVSSVSSVSSVKAQDVA